MQHSAESIYQTIMRAFIGLLLVAVAYAAPVLRVREPIPGSYIVKLHNDVDLDGIISTVRLAGGKVGSVYRIVFKGFAVELSSQVLELVSKLPSVEYVEENGIVRGQAVESWGLDRIDARSGLDDSYTPALTGAGVDVYVIDSGVNVKHVDFEGRASQIFCASNLMDTTVGGGNVDCHGHGTHCSGTVGSKTYGVAKGVKIIGVKVLNCLNRGSYDGIIEGVEWVTNEASKLFAPRSIASMSIGGGYSQAINDAVEAMVDAGVPTVVAAGNDDKDACGYSPGSSTKVITVGSTTSSDARSSFSNYGNCVDIFAPGSSIKSTWIDSTTATNTISGTSMACPHVSGALALYNSKEELMDQATFGVVSDRQGSPNLLLYVQSK